LRRIGGAIDGAPEPFLVDGRILGRPDAGKAVGGDALQFAVALDHGPLKMAGVDRRGMPEVGKTGAFEKILGRRWFMQNTASPCWRRRR
jgi:hypothetical protein